MAVMLKDQKNTTYLSPQTKNNSLLKATDWSPWIVPLKSSSFSCRKSKAEFWDAERAPLIAARHAQNDPQRQIGMAAQIMKVVVGVGDSNI